MQLPSSGLTELSGLTASRARPGWLWGHNDHGDGPYLFAIEPKKRRVVRYRVTNATNGDWEDIAIVDIAGAPTLVIADTGNSEKAVRPGGHRCLWLVREPDPTQRSRKPLSTAPAIRIDLELAKSKREDIEALFAFPRRTGRPPCVGFVTKNGNGKSRVYSLELPLAEPRRGTLVRVAKLHIAGTRGDRSITAADASRDGLRLFVLTAERVHVLAMPPSKRPDGKLPVLTPDASLGFSGLKQPEALAVLGDELWVGSEGKTPELLRIEVGAVVPRGQEHKQPDDEDRAPRP